jgi:hypothetical protein
MIAKTATSEYGVQTVRVLGLSFVLLYAAVQLPASFAPAAGWGDIFVGAVAPAVAWVVHRLSLRLNQTERKQDNDQT